MLFSDHTLLAQSIGLIAGLMGTSAFLQRHDHGLRTQLALLNKRIFHWLNATLAQIARLEGQFFRSSAAC